MPVNRMEADLDKILGALTNPCTSTGDIKCVTVLALSVASIKETDYDGIDGGQTGYTIYLEVPQTLYHQLEGKQSQIEEHLKERARELERLYSNEWICGFVVTTELVEDPNWRDKAKVMLAGEGISNQGRVRSDNLAPRICDGLLFRSQPEILLYRAFKALRVTFAPLPVLIRGGATYKRIEPDFVILKDGVLMIVEVDGDKIHRESPLEAHDRTTMMVYEGAVATESALHVRIDYRSVEQRYPRLR